MKNARGEDLLAETERVWAKMWRDLVKEFILSAKSQFLWAKKIAPSLFTLSGSVASDNDQPPDQSEEHETIKEEMATEHAQKISSVIDKETPPSDTIDQFKEDIASQVSGYISKILDLSTGRPRFCAEPVAYRAESLLIKVLVLVVKPEWSI